MFLFILFLSWYVFLYEGISRINTCMLKHYLQGMLQIGNKGTPTADSLCEMSLQTQTTEWEF